jgi:hypothetical protein
MPGTKFSSSLSRSKTGGTTSGLCLEAIQQELEKILNSSVFSSSPKLIRFLRFVVEQLVKNETNQLKEYSLGVAVFDRDQNYDPRTDPIVRVEAVRLRTKLREYYDSEGARDPVLIELPKGSYVPAVSEAPKKEVTGPISTRGFPYRGLVVSLVLITLVSLGSTTYLYLQNRSPRVRQGEAGSVRLSEEFVPIWSRFLTPGVDTYVVFGSPIFFVSNERALFIRPYEIEDAQGLESNPTFQQLQERLGTLTGPRYDYALLGEVLAVHRLTGFLVRHGAKVTALPSYKTTWDAIQNGNIILLGAPRMNHLLRHFPRQMEFEWDAEENVRNHNPRPGESEIYTARFHEGFLRQPNPRLNAHTYAIVAAFPGLRPNREILIVSVHGGPGLWETVDYLTRSETIGPLIGRLQLPDPDHHFQMLLRVYVDRGIPVRTEYVTHHLTPFNQNEGGR